MDSSSPYLTVLLCVYSLFFLILILALVSAIRVVREDKRLEVYRLGRYIGEKGPGLVILIPFVDRGVWKDSGNLQAFRDPGLVGATGETRTTVFTGGKVLINGQEWEATSQSVISAGRRVRVVKMILEVEEEF
jgi:regulator of protease activity HflC (stomatin/prohibitin superfamily)